MFEILYIIFKLKTSCASLFKMPKINLRNHALCVIVVVILLVCEYYLLCGGNSVSVQNGIRNTQTNIDNATSAVDSAIEKQRRITTGIISAETRNNEIEKRINNVASSIVEAERRIDKLERNLKDDRTRLTACERELRKSEQVIERVEQRYKARNE